MRSCALRVIFCAVLLFISAAIVEWPARVAADTSFHNAPASAAQLKNPYAGDAQAVATGKKLYGQNCAQCHGNDLQGIGPAPPLVNDRTKNAKPGEVFWFITTGNLANGMPAWTNLSKQQRWQIVTFLETRFKAGN